jgi:penicillin-binding protein 2
MENRKHIILGLVILVGIIFLIKLAQIQLFNEDYKLAAMDNAIQRLTKYPYRGLIYDRKNRLLVTNKPIFDLFFIPKDLRVEDSSKFALAIGLSKDELRLRIEEGRNYSMVKPTLLQKQLSFEQFNAISSMLVDYPGVIVQPRTVRTYPHESAANVLGYIGEVSKKELDRRKDTDYTQGDYVGVSGLEQNYETVLRGKKGVQYVMVNVRGVVKGSFKEGKFDTTAVAGEDIVTTLDLDLQQYAEKLMEGKIGSVVAIEPSTGEILSLVSSPSYDPNLLTGASFSENFAQLSSDSMKPLFNRAIMAMYRPGSIFKTAQALIALQEGVITPETRIACIRNVVGCHGAHTILDLLGAITNSCNPYFMGVMRRVVNRDQSSNPYTDTRLGMEVWHRHIRSFGLGGTLGVDIPNEKGGLMPSVRYYDKAYRGRPWKYSNIYSISIGEGENLVVPLQMANFACILANRGYYFTPHLVKGIGQDKKPVERFTEKHYTTIDSAHFRTIVNAMENVVRYGTGSYRAQLKDVVLCGKTGTVQNKDKEDHSVFIAFAPKDNPKIAVSVYVEYAGQGARAAASIASLIIEKHLFGETKRKWIEDYALKGDFK